MHFFSTILPKNIYGNICILSHKFWMNQGSDLLSTLKWPSKPQFCENWYRWHTVCMVSQSNKSLFEFKSYFPTQCQVWPNRDLWVEICNKIFKKSHSYTPFFNSRQSYIAGYPKKCTDLFHHADRVQIFTAICPIIQTVTTAQWRWC